MCGMKTNTLSIYIDRGKVNVTDNEIDIDAPRNKDFIQKRKDKMRGAKKAPAKKVVSKPKAKPNQVPDKKLVVEEAKPLPVKEKPQNKPDKKQREIEFENDGLYSLDKVKRGYEIDKLREEAELKRIQREKLQGILIPTELVKALLILHSKSISTAFHQAADNLLVEFSALKKLTTPETAKLRGIIISITNTAIINSIEQSKKGIGSIVDEYSETRNRGEKK